MNTTQDVPTARRHRLRRAALVVLVAAGLAGHADSAPLAWQDAGVAPLPSSPPEIVPASSIAPPVGELPFSKLPYAEARDAAATAGKLFVVDATASWCVPCKQMEAEAWPVAKVGEWVAAHAVAVQIDVDEQKDIAQELVIEAMPTIIVFRAGAELDRHTGRMDADELVTWLDDVAAGRAGEGPLLAKGRALLTSTDYKARYKIAQELQQHHKDELALLHYVWLWPNTRGTSFTGVRSSFMLSDMKRLADRSEAAREAFADIYDEVRAAVADEAEPDRMTWLEFARWSDTFEHPEDLMAWYERHREPDGSLRSPWAADSVFEAMVERGDWAAAGRLGNLPAWADAKLGEVAAMSAALKLAGASEMQKQMAEFQSEQLRTELSRLSAAALAAGHDEQGRAIASKLLHELDDAPTRLALVAAMLEAVGPRPEQPAWLDEAEAKGGDGEQIAALREKLAAAVAAAPPAPAAPLQPASPPEPIR